MTPKPQWLDLRLSVGNLISIVILIGGMAASWYNLKQEQAVSVLRLEQVDALQSQDIKSLHAQFLENKARIQKIEAGRNDIQDRLIRLEVGQSQQNDILRQVLSAVKNRQ